MDTPHDEVDPGLTLLEKLKEMQEDTIRTRQRLEELESEVEELRTTERYRAIMTLFMWGKEKIMPMFKPDDRGLSQSEGT